MRCLLLALLLVVTPLAGCTVGPPAPGTPRGSGQGPAWSFTDTEGAVHTHDAPPGNATVLFFMATWCTSCRSKAPVLAQVHQEYADRGVRFYSLDFDASETNADLEKWKADHAQPWPHGIDEGLRLQRTFGVTTQSSVVLLDAQGQVVRKWGYGAVTAEELRAELDRVLAA